jgi:hypothetical protein
MTRIIRSSHVILSAAKDPNSGRFFAANSPDKRRMFAALHSSFFNHQSSMR